MVHGDGEEKDKEKEVDAKDGLQEASEGLGREHVQVHPDEDDDGQEREHADDDAGGAFGAVGVGQGLLNEGVFGVGISGDWFGAHAGFLSVRRCLRRVETPA
jgi:hypothetical protein